MDSVTDENIWAKRYDSSLDDFFKVQDEVTRKIVTALEVKLAAEDQKHLTRTHTVKINAYDHLLFPHASKNYALSVQGFSYYK